MNRVTYIAIKCREWQGLVSRIVANSFVRQRHKADRPSAGLAAG